jgi:hypothetical protein
LTDKKSNALYNGVNVQSKIAKQQSTAFLLATNAKGAENTMPYICSHKKQAYVQHQGKNKATPK